MRGTQAIIGQPAPRHAIWLPRNFFELYSKRYKLSSVHSVVYGARFPSREHSSKPIRDWLNTMFAGNIG